MLAYIYSWLFTIATFLLGTIAGYQGNWNGLLWTKNRAFELWAFIVVKLTPLMEKTRKHWEPLWKKVEPSVTGVRRQVMIWEMNARSGGGGGGNNDNAMTDFNMDEKAT